MNATESCLGAGEKSGGSEGNVMTDDYDSMVEGMSAGSSEIGVNGALRNCMAYEFVWTSLLIYTDLVIST